MRTIASQMKDAERSDGSPCKIDRHARPRARRALHVRRLRPHDHVLRLPQGLRGGGRRRRRTVRRRPDPAAPTGRRDSRCAPSEVTASGHETRPPARYTEPSLVAKLEELEIGRPSTYASIIRTITSRDYVFKKGSALVPTWLAFAVTRLLEEHFPKLVDYAFTAEMEDVLDEIADGRAAAAAGADRLLLRQPRRRTTPTTARVCSGWSPSSATSTPASCPPSRSAIWTTSRAPGSRSGSAATAPTSRTTESRRANVADDLPPDELTVDLARELLSQADGRGARARRRPGERHRRSWPATAASVPTSPRCCAEDAPKNAKPERVRCSRR